jgi:hypothetical protein
LVEIHERRNSGAALNSFGIVGGAAVGLLAGVGVLAIRGLRAVAVAADL